MKIKTLLLLLCLPFYLWSQDFELGGTVVDKETGNTLSNAHILVKNTLVGTISNLKGEFDLHLPEKLKKEELVLIIRKLGYFQVQHKIVGNAKNIKIELQASDLLLSEVLVSAYKNKLSDRNNSTVPILLSGKEITSFGAQNIPDILLKQAGVSLAGQSYHAAPSIRGLARKRVIVLLDGEKISSERNVGAPGTFINPAEIERIEILKGPYSTLYGSDAIGGVVNIISKSYEPTFYNDKIGGKVSLNYKSVNNGINGNIALNGKSKKLKYHIHSGYRKSDNYKIPDNSELMSTFAEEKHIGGKFIYNINTNNQLIFKALFSKGGPIGKPAYDILTNAQHNYDDHYIVGFKYKCLNISKTISKIELNASRHEHNLGAKIIKHKQEENSEDDKLINNQKDLEGVDYFTQLDIYLSLNDKIDIIAGFDGYFRTNVNISEQKFVSNYNTGIFLMNKTADLMINGYQNSYGIFAQSNFELTENFILNTGARWNYVELSNPTVDKSQNRNAWSGNAGFSFLPFRNLSIKANFGSAFRMPDIKELYVTTKTPGGLNISNLDLVPERSFNIDFALVYSNKSSVFKLSAFRNTIKDMIILDWNTSLANREGVFKNIGKGLLYGIEFSTNFEINRNINIHANISKIYGKDVNAQDELMDVPPFQLNAGFGIKPVKKLKLALSCRFSAEQSEVAEDDIPNDAFTVFDFEASFNLLKNLKLNASVSNILNAKYREHFQFAWMHAPARSFNIGFNFNF